MTRRIRVLIIDDSAIFRKVLSDVLAGDPDIEVVGAVPDPLAAMEKMATVRPDVLTLDLEMPRMDGLTFLRRVMASSPLPVIVISSLAQAGCSSAITAMEAGAVEVLAKPSGPYSVGDLKLTLGRKIRSAALAGPRLAARSRTPASTGTGPRQVIGQLSPAVVLMGASTGGTEAIRQVLEALPADCPPVIAVQHIPAVFSRSFAERLDGCCEIRVREARNGDPLEHGTALIAPGDYHVVLRGTSGLIVQVRQGPRVCYQRPSVDVLFESGASVCGSRAIGVILTGMGNDGAAGLLSLRRGGAVTIAQDESTSVVYGMPAEAVRLGAAQQVLPLHKIPDAICSFARQMRPTVTGTRAG